MTNWKITGKWIKKGRMTTKDQTIAAKNIGAAWERAIGLMKGAAEIRCEATQSSVTRNVRTKTSGTTDEEASGTIEEVVEQGLDAIASPKGREAAAKRRESGAKPNLFVEKAKEPEKKNPFLKNSKRKAST